MASLGGEIESESSDEEWVFSSSKDQTKQRSASPAKKQQKLAISAASIRTIQANIPKSNRLPPFQPSLPLPSQILKSVTNTTTQVTPVVKLPAKIVLQQDESPSLQFISDKELEDMCTEMNAQLLVSRLVDVYKSCEIFIRIREIETQTMSIENRLKDHLFYSSDPCGFILETLSALSYYFADHPKNKDLNSKFRRLLANTFCTALARFLDTPIGKRQSPLLSNKSISLMVEGETDLISFDDHQSANGEVDLISFDDVYPSAVSVPVVNGRDSKDDEEEDDKEDKDDDEEEEEEEEVITLAQILGVRAEIIDRYTLTRDHQVKLIQMIDSIPSPVIVYYAMDIYKMANLASFGCEYEDDGVKLCRALMKHGHYDEAVNCIRKLNLYPRFPINVIADQFFTAGHGTSLPALIQGQPTLQRELLSFINKQLRFNYAGNLDIVPREYLADLIDGTDTTQQLSRLKERKFQKDLVNCGAKILKECDIKDGAEEDYYFINLSQRYACLRFILAQRAIQQVEDGDLSIEASSNFNGLIDLVCEGDPVLARLAIKELIDTGDTIAPPYFASLYKQQEFYCRYNALPLSHRLLGIVKGEQMSRHRSMFTPKKASNSNGLAYYTLPPKAQWMMVDSHSSLMRMKDILSTSNICGIDTEWVPTFAKTGTVKTALMQIACDIEGFVFLLDLKTIFQPENQQLYYITEKILQLLFEDDQILKIAFDFGGDFDLLHSSIPSSKTWHVSKLLDLKSLKTMPTASADQGQPITGGLAGVTSIFVGVTLNKRQQLSNWEKRPLTEEQAIYGACDAYCLLDIYYTLKRLNHPFIKNINNEMNTTESPSNLSISNNPNNSSA